MVRSSTSCPPWLIAAHDQLAAAVAHLNRSLVGDSDDDGGDPYAAFEALYTLSHASTHALYKLDVATGFESALPQFVLVQEILRGWQCETCRRPMPFADSCTHTFYAVDGALYRRVPYGQEPDWPSNDGEDTARPLRDRLCYGCGVAIGGYHHAWCESEVCPLCPDDPLIICPHFQQDGFHSGTVLRTAIREARRLLRAGHTPIGQAKG